jgi:hypothetical protein
MWSVGNRARRTGPTLRRMAKKLSAADYIERYDGEMRIILGELAENAAIANLNWAHAALSVRQSPEAALKHLADAWVALATAVKIERRDALRRINAASDLLDAELPDNDSD